MTDRIRLIVCFVIGTAAVATFFVFFQFAVSPLVYGGSSAARVIFGAILVTIVMAGILAWPILLIACILLATFHNPIYRNFGMWCAVAVPVSAVAYVAIDYIALGTGNISFADHLMLQPVITRIALAMSTALVTAAGFYFWVRGRVLSRTILTGVSDKCR